MRAQASALFAILLAPAVCGQTFDAASIKPAETAGNGGSWVGSQGGPGSDDPTRIRFHNMSLANLIQSAYGISYYQYSGPEWTNDARFEVVAKMPEGTTREQMRTMLQHLLAEQFHLSVHRDSKTISLYVLTVASGGSKLRESVPVTQPPANDDKGKAGPAQLKRDKDGYPDLPPGIGMAIMSGPKGVSYARLRGSNQAIKFLVGQLGSQLAAPVEDETGLTGKYDFVLSWIAQPPNSLSPDSGEVGPDLIAAVQQQLGLKLTSKKGPIETLVVDQVDKQPSGN